MGSKVVHPMGHDAFSFTVYEPIKVLEWINAPIKVMQARMSTKC